VVYYSYRRKNLAGMLYHAAVMHGIAQLALFGNHGAMCVFSGTRKSPVLVGVNGPLPCNKTEYQHPRANDISVTFSHFKNDAQPLPFVASFRKNNETDKQIVIKR